MEKLITRLAGRVSFHGLDVIVRFDPESLKMELKHLSYGATTEQPTHLLNFYLPVQFGQSFEPSIFPWLLCLCFSKFVNVLSLQIILV